MYSISKRFGGGYTLQIKVDKDSTINSLVEFVESQFQNCILKVNPKKLLFFFVLLLKYV